MQNSSDPLPHQHNVQAQNPGMQAAPTSHSESLDALKRASVVMFDLGGVLYHINLQRTKDSFSLLAGRDVDFSLTSQHPVFDEFECGRIGIPAFRDGLRHAYGIDADDTMMDAAWNALLVGLDPRALSWLRHVRTTHRIILLSNINALHHARIKDECAEVFAECEQLFLSYEMGLRKPWPEIYAEVLQRMNMDAADLFYFDDSPQHIATAQSMHIPCHRVMSIDDMPDLLGL